MHPWQVNIERWKRGWHHWCGGTIINNEWILSAAHCFDDFVRRYDDSRAKLNITDLRVTVGNHDLKKHDEYEKMFNVEYIVKHWNYSGMYLYGINFGEFITDFQRSYTNNDIALLKVKSTSGITFNDYIQPACLPEDLTLLLSEIKCQVSGWGKDNFHGEISYKLKAVEVPIIPGDVCQSNYNKYSIDFENVICAGDTTADTCQGDSGGPLICNINGLSTVIGITSWGEGCSQNDSPGVYTKVSAYIKWIHEQISNHRLEVTSGCKLSADRRYMFFNMDGVEQMPGDHIAVGDTLTVKCRFIDMYSYMTYEYYYDDYGNYNDTDIAADVITISCKYDNKMTKIHKECPEAPKYDGCLKIDNGNVTISNNFYVVSCDKGFSLDIFEPEEKRSNCINGELKSVIGGQEPKCIPDRCKIPYDFDTFLSITDRFHVYISGGSVVELGDFVYFNCSKPGDDIHEPVNRRFKCINGQWIEDERNKLWKLGNYGNFPKCRKTICEPVCQNGGVCWRDDRCNCKHLTYGKRCENVICDDKCYANNGECVGPGKCKCPEGKFGNNCGLSACRLPDIENMAKLNIRRTYYGTGETVRDFTCSLGYFLSSDEGMTCQNNGEWSDVITCVKG
ncbi:uncharacterized protein LOC132752268 [Ruditapes philippinarum]|uniref:uncharacterized protein LOC132752268 n=1 Tax=Ruditapes philippinarum TaxID=129788 RepID=UPI00295B4FD9|nr:uncharacterized protein LOC132752268 [Ruditapes philippinarum]